jgi:hypothetical protein
MTDVDLLVEPHADTTARTVLAELGFRSVPSAWLHHATTWERAGLVIDLHRGILAEGRSQIDLAAVWSRTVPGWPSGAERLEPIDELVFHLLHMVRNRLCGPLIQVVDAARLAARLPAATVALERARGWGVGFAAELAWRFVEAIAEDRPGRAGGWLGPDVDDVIAVRQPSSLRKIVFDVATAGSPRQLATRALALGASQLARRR